MYLWEELLLLLHYINNKYKTIKTVLCKNNENNEKQQHRITLSDLSHKKVITNVLTRQKASINLVLVNHLNILSAERHFISTIN